VAETDAQARTLIAAGFGQWSAAISDGLRRLHAAGHLPDGTDPDDLAVTLLAALQGGLILAQVQRDTRPLETAVDTVLELARLRRRDGPADSDTSGAALFACHPVEAFAQQIGVAKVPGTTYQNLSAGSRR
jgi:hypothetical protein